MSRTRNIFSGMLLLGGGAAFGTIFSLLIGPYLNSASDTNENQSVTTTTNVLSKDDPKYDKTHRRLSRLLSNQNASKISDLKNRIDEMPPQKGEDDSSNEEVLRDMLSPEGSEEAKQATLDRWDDKLATHDDEPYDRKWAGEAGKKFEMDVSRMAEGSAFELQETDCRSTSCTSTLKWPNYAAAIEEYTQLLHGSYQQNCAKEILLPQPENDDAPYEGKVLFTCERADSS